MKFISRLLVLFSILSSCRMAVDVEVPFPGPVLVANSYFNPDSVWSVHLSASRHILDENPYPEISNAALEIYENNEFIERLEYSGNGYYRSESTRPKEGAEYKLKISTPEFGEVLATDEVPEKPAFVSGSWKRGLSEFGDYEYLITLNISDPPAKDNFYMVQVLLYSPVFDWQKPREPGPITPVDSVLDGATLSTQDPAVSQNNQYQETLIFSDTFFDGDTYAFQLTASHYSIRNQIVSKGEAEVYIVLKSLSKSSFEYWKSLRMQQDDNELAEPVSVFSNIEGGLGFFGGYSSVTKVAVIRMEEDRGEF